MTTPEPSTDLTLIDRARGLVITCDEQYAVAAAFRQSIRALRDEIAAGYDDEIKQAHELHTALIAKKRAAEADAVTADGIVKTAMLAWNAERERRAQAEADARREADLAALLEAAVAAEDAGDLDRADAILVDVATATAPPLPTSGTLRTERWSARVDDFDALVVYAAAHPSARGLLLANHSALNAQARSLRARLAIPGVTAVRTKDLGVRRG